MKASFMFILLLALAGCHRPETEFRALASRLEKNDTRLYGPVKIDIRKTDSLISPLIGEIEYTEAWDRTNDLHKDILLAGETCRLHFAYQHKTWVLVSAQNRLNGTLVDATDTSSHWWDSSLEQYQRLLH